MFASDPLDGATVTDTTIGTVEDVAAESDADVAAGVGACEVPDFPDSVCESHPSIVAPPAIVATASTPMSRLPRRRDRGTIRIVEHILVRRAVEGDFAALQDVFRRASWSNKHDRPLLAAHPEFLELSPVAVSEGRTHVATLGGSVVGFTSVIDHGDVVELEDLFVEPDVMRRGVGRALIDDVVARARAGGAQRLEVDGNDHALDFYASVGFVARERVALDHGSATRMTMPL